jgi:hypothetical protein
MNQEMQVRGLLIRTVKLETESRLHTSRIETLLTLVSALARNQGLSDIQQAADASLRLIPPRDDVVPPADG